MQTNDDIMTSSLEFLRQDARWTLPNFQKWAMEDLTLNINSRSEFDFWWFVTMMRMTMVEERTKQMVSLSLAFHMGAKLRRKKVSESRVYNHDFYYLPISVQVLQLISRHGLNISYHFVVFTPYSMIWLSWEGIFFRMIASVVGGRVRGCVASCSYCYANMAAFQVFGEKNLWKCPIAISIMKHFFHSVL